MIYVYWLLAVPTMLLGGVVILFTLGGQRLSSATPPWLALIAAGAMLGLAGWGYKVATSGGRPGMAALWVILSWVVFAGATVVNGLMGQRIWS